MQTDGDKHGMGREIEEHHVAAFLSGNPDALDDASLMILTNFAAGLIRYRYGRDKVRDADLEDLAHEAIESAWIARRSFRGDAAFTTWLARIIVRTAFKHYLRLRPEMVKSTSFETGEGNDEDGWKELQLPSDGQFRDTTHEIVKTRILWDYAETMLSERQLHAFKMAFDGHTEYEIGVSLAASNPASAAKQLIKAARGKLKRIFALAADHGDGAEAKGSDGKV